MPRMNMSGAFWNLIASDVGGRKPAHIFNAGYQDDICVKAEPIPFLSRWSSVLCLRLVLLMRRC